MAALCAHLGQPEPQPEPPRTPSCHCSELPGVPALRLLHTCLGGPSPLPGKLLCRRKAVGPCGLLQLRHSAPASLLGLLRGQGGRCCCGRGQQAQRAESSASLPGVLRQAGRVSQELAGSRCGQGRPAVLFTAHTHHPGLVPALRPTCCVCLWAH